ncbi:class I SAM-dependent methyltransferase [Alteromonas gilva]|uniref:Ribosomal RNA small subunit methyltransferase J n=1 Tax=Alteromonas gilva TaxID=2987522 RepID=A0ABT5L4L7_9ALTE|nr:class I SAM-dependent methyltransferase [Alteromonas gilva]MDC8831985.1 class I SAM-dependent methyltransferase [Alteromonas gilva]
MLSLPPLLLSAGQASAPSPVEQTLIEQARSVGLSCTSSTDAELALQICDGALQLYDLNEPQGKGVIVDFLSGQSAYRRAKGGGSKEPIARSLGIKTGQPLTILDATPGLGRDAFVLVALGASVTLVERSPVAYMLLADGLRRLALSEPELAARFTLLHANSTDYMQQQSAKSVDAVYLDPMFPHRKKSALVKKEMRLFQAMLGTDEDADLLLPAALHVAAKRVAVKRPNNAPFLAGQKPSMAITSKKHRFDVYINN